MMFCRNCVPLGHDGGGLPERDAVPVLPALDACRPPPLAPPRQESGSHLREQDASRNG
jgi:hypothetical protein